MSFQSVAACIAPTERDQAGAWPWHQSGDRSGISGADSVDPGGMNHGTGMSLMAHELRSSMASIVSSAEVLADDWSRLDPAQAQGMVSAMHRRALWLQRLIDNMFCMSLIERGRFSLQPRPISALDIVHEACSVAEPLLAPKRQKLHISAPVDVPRLQADPIRLVQVLINLILNASKYSPEGTRITVQISFTAAVLRVSVLDRGIGFARGEAERLFEAFYRAPAAGSTSSEGIGLGLAIVKAVVEAHGGRVRAEPRPGGGAQFWFELPISDSGRLSSLVGTTVGV